LVNKSELTQRVKGCFILLDGYATV